MNTQTQEALKMAQEVLNLYCEQLYSKFANDALKAIDEALAQPAQEPVDVARVQEDGYVEWNPDLPDLPVGTKLYTHHAPAIVQEPFDLVKLIGKHKLLYPVKFYSDNECHAIERLKQFAEDYRKQIEHHAPSWQGLSAVEVSNIFISKEVNGNATQFARAIEQELKRKNGFNDVKEKNYG